MKQEYIKKEIINIISKSQKEFDENLKNKNVMFVYEDNKGNVDKVEVVLPVSCFYHLTGVMAYDKDNKLINSYKFYNLLNKNRISSMNIKIKNKTTYYKLNVLPQLMKIDRNANMIGEFVGNNLYLRTEKVAGNVNACMGFIKNTKLESVYIPNTILKEDIRKITSNRNKIVGIMKKDINDELYEEITYLKNNYEVIQIIKCGKFAKVVNYIKLKSNDKLISKKILEFKKVLIEELKKVEFIGKEEVKFYPIQTN